jgi:hypothetical protein
MGGRFCSLPRMFKIPDEDVQGYVFQFQLSVCFFPIFLQGVQEIAAAARAQKFVVFDHGSGADAG